MASSSVRFEIDKSLSDFKWEAAGLVRLLQGPVAADLARRAINVESAAKQNASGRPGPNVISGLLRGSITWRAGSDALSPYVDIGSAVVYAP